MSQKEKHLKHENPLERMFRRIAEKGGPASVHEPHETERHTDFVRDGKSHLPASAMREHVAPLKKKKAA